jgi:hypothetical protein
MFAGLPGIGVGTLFYVLIALCLPFVEIVHVARGTSSLARWRRIGRQFSFALSIIVSIMIAERVLMWTLGQAGPESLNPARLLNRELIAAAPRSILAAPIMASILLLGAVLLLGELVYLATTIRRNRASARARVLESTTE